MATNTDKREEIKPVAPTEQTKWRDPSLVGKYMVDPKTGLAGLFRSPDNGETWVLTDTVYGHVYNQDEVDNIWDNGAGHKVADEIKSATADLPNIRKQADEAVKFAESAVAASKVNSDAIVAQSEAISEAKSAMDSATAEIQQTAANAASDAAKIRADVAQVQSEVDTAKAANSASVEALKSDVSAAKQDLADVHDSLDKAQSAIEQNQKLINDSVTKITSDVSATKQDLADVHDSLAKAQAAAEANQKAIDQSIAQINTNVDATNQDLAGVRKDLTKAQSDITANQKAIDDNVAQISDDITQDRKDIADVRQGLTKAQSDITANQKAVNDNVAQINADITQDRKDIASAQQANADTAKQLDTYSKQATEQGKTIKSIQDKQDGFTATIADVQGNVTQVSDKVDGLSASLKDAQDNVASVKAQADQLSATLTDHAKSIATLTASAKELSSTLEDADGRLSKVEQTAQTNSSTLSDVQGNLSQVKQQADGLVTTLKDAQGNISTLQQKADSVSAQLASAQGDIATLQTGVDGVKATLTSHDKSIHTLQADSKSLKDSMVNAQGDISTLRKTATDVTSELEDHTGRLSKVEQNAATQATTLSDLQGNLSQVEQKADSNTTTISSINKNAMQDRGVITDTNTSFDSLTHLGTYSIKAIGLPKMPEQHYGTLAVSGSAGSGWISQQFVADTTGNVYTRVFSNNAWSAWKQGGSQDAINQVKQTADSNSATIRNVQGDVSTLKQTATGIKSTLASHEGYIHTLQADSKSLKDSMTNAQGDISTLQKTATSLDSEMKDHAGRLSKVEQSATMQATTLSDLQGNLTQVKQQADGLVTTLKDAQGNITQIQQKADGTLEQLKSAQGDIASLQTDVTGIKATLTSHEGDIHTLQADSKTLKDDMADAQGNISSLQKSSTKLDSEFSSQDGRLSKVEQTANEHTSTISDLGDKLNNMKIGGRNLLTNTDKDISVTSHTTDGWPAWANVDTGFSFEHGKTYTFSTEAKNSTSKIAEASIRVFEYSTNTQVGIYAFPADGKRHSITFSIPNDSHNYHLLLYAGHAGIVPGVNVTTTYHHPKLEEGNVATDWTPAPEDLATTTQVKQTADGIETTLKSAQGDIDQIKQTAKGTSEQLSNVQGDVTNIQKDVNGLKQTTADNAGNIHTLQVDSKTLKDDMADAKGNISSLQKTSTSLVSEFKDHDGRISKAEQTASTLVNEFADQQGHLNRVEQTAQGTQQTVANQQGQINNIKTDAAGIHETLTGQGNQIANINVTLSGLNSKYEGVSGDLNNLKSQTQWVTVNSAVDLNNVKTPCHEFLKGTVTNAPNETAWWYLTVESSDDGNRVTQTVIADQSNNRYTRRWADVWSAWVKDATQTDVTALSNRITTNSTQITQNKKEIDLKADQSTVDNLTGEVSQAQAQLKVQADQISSKVSSTDFKTLNDKVNNLRIGGRNLIPNSGTDIVIESKTTDPYPAWDNKVVYWDLTPGETYTFSVSATNTNGVEQASVRIYKDSLNGKYINKEATHWFFNADGERHSFTFTTPNNDIHYDIWLYAGPMGKLQGKDFATTYHHPQLELGNIESDYSPNPDDIITAIQKNSTAIDQTNSKISLKADQTEVDNVKNTAQQISSRLDILAGEVKSKVDETRVNNIVDGKGYATTSTVQSLVDQKAGTINENIVKLDQTVKQGAENNVQLVRKSDFADGKGSWTVQGIASATNPAPPAELGQTGMNVLQTNTRDAYEDGIWYSVKPGEKFDVDFWCAPSSAFHSSLGLVFADKDKVNWNWRGVQTDQSGQWKHYTGTIMAPVNAMFAKPWYQMDKPASNTANSSWLAKPSIRRQNATTVNAIQSLTASIDGLQSRVTNYQNDTSSKYTQLSNLMQSKVGTADFDNLKRSVDMQTLDSADINNMKTNGHYFVHNLNNSPIAGWVYVDVTGNGNNRIRQDVYQDSGLKHKYRRWFGTYWTGWEEGATYTEITQLQDALNLRVQKGELLSQINLTAGNTLIQSNKLYLDASSVVFSGRAFIPSAAIASLSADKINTGWLNTNNVSLGDGRTRIRADHDYMYIQPTGSAASNTGIRMGYSGLDFLTNVIPNGYNSSVPYYSIGYDGASNGYLRISAFDHINPGGTTATQNWYTMVDAISLTNSEINFATKGNMHMQVVNGGVNIKPTLFFQNNTNNGTFAGFNRLDNSNTVEFNTGDNNGENFHVNSGARFMKYVYFNDYCRAQGWLTYSTLSKKTNIKKLDTSLALDKIRQDDQYLYEYKRNVAKGVYDPQASFIIDDVNDVSHYSVPREFIDQTGKYREPSVELSYLIAAFQEIDKQVQLQKEEIKELKEKLQHE